MKTWIIPIFLLLLGMGSMNTRLHARTTDTLAVFECDTARIGVHFENNFSIATLYYLDQSYKLHQSRSASGAKYVKGDSLLFWNKGEEAVIEIKDKRFNKCRVDKRELSWFRARLQGAVFRAVGQEPGWIVEIDKNGGGTLLLNYGTERLELREISKQSRNERRASYLAQTDSGQVRIKATKETCRDPMNGNRSPLSVTVKLGGRIFEGCGRSWFPVDSVDVRKD